MPLGDIDIDHLRAVAPPGGAVGLEYHRARCEPAGSLMSRITDNEAA